MPTAQQFTNYITANQAVAESADRIAASVAARGTPEFTQAFQTALIDHARDFGVSEGRAGASELLNAANNEQFFANLDQAVENFNNAGGGNQGGGNNTFTGNVDLTPITNLIGTDAGPGGAGDRTTIMGRQKLLQDSLKAGQQGIRDVVDPLGEQVTGLETSIGTAGDVKQFGQPVRPEGATRPDASTLMGRQDIIATDLGGLSNRIGVKATDDLPATGLFAGQAGLMSGIGQQATDTAPATGLYGGQAGIQTAIGTGAVGETPATGLYAGQAGLTAGQADIQAGIGEAGAGQTDLFQGQADIQAGIGQQATDTAPATGLFAGQAGLMSGQQGLTQGLSGLGKDLSSIGTDIQENLGGQLRGIGGDLKAFEDASKLYQQGATAQRGDLQNTQRAGQQNLVQQIQGVGQQANRTAEMMAQQRLMQPPAVQQQAANFAAAAPRAMPQNIGPLGPQAQDPRDSLLQEMQNRRPGLMSQ